VLLESNIIRKMRIITVAAHTGFMRMTQLSPYGPLWSFRRSYWRAYCRCPLVVIRGWFR